MGILNWILTVLLGCCNVCGNPEENSSPTQRMQDIHKTSIIQEADSDESSSDFDSLKDSLANIYRIK